MRDEGRMGIASLLLVVIFACLALGGFYRPATAQARSPIDPAHLAQRYDIDRDRAELISQLVDRYVEEIGGLETYRNVMLKIGTKPSPQSISDHGGFLAMRGAVRLGKSAIDSLASLRSSLFNRLGEDNCNLLVGKSKRAANGWRMMAALDSATLAGMFDFYVQTTLAVQNEAGEPPQFDRDRLVAAWRSFHRKLPPSEQNRFIRFLDMPTKSVEEECWFQRRLWELLPQIPEQDARVIVWQIATAKY